ncbi:MAG TPA: glycogen-binding domain-containing protein [Polyangia bacterium]
MVRTPRPGAALVGALLLCSLARPAAAQPRLLGGAELDLGYGYDTNLFLDAVPALTHGDVLAGQPAQSPYLHVLAAPRAALRLGGHVLEGSYGLALRQTGSYGAILDQTGRVAYRTPRLGPLDLTLAALVDRYLITATAQHADSFWAAGGEATVGALLGAATRTWAGYRGLWRAYPELAVPGPPGTQRDVEHTGTLGVATRPRYDLELLGTLAAAHNASSDERLELWRGRLTAGVRWQPHGRLTLGLDYAVAVQWLPQGTLTPLGRGGLDVAARTDVIHTGGAQVLLGITRGVELFARYEGAVATSTDPTVEYRRHVAVTGIAVAFGGSRLLATPGPEEAGPATPVQATTDGARVRFRLLAPAASEVAVIGDFNGWDPARGAMHRDAGGVWDTVLDVSRGRHAYGFLVDGRPRLPKGAPLAPDGFGGQSAIVAVP